MTKLNKEMSQSMFEESEKTSIQSPFVNRKIVIEGVFHTIKKETLKTRIRRLGGEVVTGDVTKNIHYFVMGDNIPSDKMEKYDKLCFNGYNIKTLSETDVLNICNGQFDQYIVADENVKDLHLTIDHYVNKHVTYPTKITEPSGREYIPNPIYGKNLYLGGGITGSRMILQQILGLVGVYSGQGLSDATQVIVLSHGAYEALKQGVEHPEITLIQDTYNKGLAMWYDYLLTTEEDLLLWLKARLELCPDSVCQKLYDDFLESKK